MAKASGDYQGSVNRSDLNTYWTAVADNTTAPWNHPYRSGQPYYWTSGVNICWQDTTSNATYCSAANALSIT